jgi:hypothetical protein
VHARSPKRWRLEVNERIVDSSPRAQCAGVCSRGVALQPRRRRRRRRGALTAGHGRR